TTLRADYEKRSVLAVRLQIDGTQLRSICRTVEQWLIEFEEDRVKGDPKGGYDLNGKKNCAGFVQACCESAGILFPDLCQVPSYSSKLGATRIRTPNSLYLGLKLSPYSFNPIKAPAAAQDLAPTGIGMMLPKLFAN